MWHGDWLPWSIDLRVYSVATLDTSMMKIRTLVSTIALVLSGSVHSAPLPYNEAGDAKLEVLQALSAAKFVKLPVLVIFGANWCEDCRALDTALKSQKNAALMSKEFLVVKVDVGNFDRNLDLSTLYGNPINTGIPAALILSPRNKILYTTRAGELSNARRMSDTGIYDFFRRIAASAKTSQ